MMNIVFIVLLTLVSANYSASSKLIEKAVHITSKYYNHNFVTSVVWTQMNSAGVDDFLMKYPGSVVITDLSDNKNNTIHNFTQDLGYMQTVFFATESESLEKFMNILNGNLRFPVSVVLVIVKPVSKLRDLSTYNNIAWKNDLVDLVIISENEDNDVTLSTYFPFNDGKCGNDLPVSLNFDENVFPNKYKNFNNCSIRVIAVNFLPYVKVVSENEVRGLDGITLTIIANNLNASLTVIEASIESGYGTYSNGTATGAFGYMMNKNADILIPFGLLTRDRYSMSQVSKMYHRLDIRWIGPERRQISSSIKVLMPLFNIITPLLCLAFILFVVLTILIKRRTLSRQGHKSTSFCFHTYALLLGQPTNYVTKVPLLNNLFLLWIWFSLIICIDYQSDLVKFLQNEILEPPFDLLEEAVTRVDGYGGSEVFLDYYRDTPLESGYKILSLPVFRGYIKRIVDGERFLLATDTFLVRNFRHSVQILNKQISSASSCLYMRPAWPGAKNVDSIIIRLVEAGLVEKIIHNDDVEHINGTTIDIAQALDMATLSLCFYGIGVMSLVCFLIFIIEVIYFKYDRYKGKKQKRILAKLNKVVTSFRNNNYVPVP